MVSERQKTCKKIVRMEFFAVFLLWTIVQLNFPASPELTTQLQKLRLWLEQCAALNSINLFNQDTLCVISLKDKHQRMRKEIWLQKMTRKAVLFDQERGIMRVNRCLSLSLCFVKHLAYSFLQQYRYNWHKGEISIQNYFHSIFVSLFLLLWVSLMKFKMRVHLGNYFYFEICLRWFLWPTNLSVSN